METQEEGPGTGRLFVQSPEGAMVQKLVVDPRFEFVSPCGGLHTCQLSVSVGKDGEDLLVVVTQRRGDRHPETTIADAEAIAQDVMLRIVPALPPRFLMCPTQIVWVFGDTDSLSEAHTLAEFDWERSAWPQRLGQPYDYTRRPVVTFGHSVQVANDAHLLACDSGGSVVEIPWLS